ncbi:MAG TPA: hypothetical protein VEG68_09535 [Terriglobales bacterium]|nr:hypothetical protein [Terriglobales bacterium]
MKLKSLAVITLIVLCCSAASAQSYAFGFLNYTGGQQYCNYEIFTTGGAGNFYLTGMDVLDACASSANPFATIEGTGIRVTLEDIESTGLQPGITGPGRYIYADAIMDAYAGDYTGEQWLTITATSVNKKNEAGKWNWDSFLGFSGYEFLGAYGFLTDKLPDKSSEAVKGANAAGPTFKASSDALKKDKTSRRTTLQ